MPVPTRTSADSNSSADINTLQSQITAGVAFTLSTPGTNQTLTSASAVRQSMAPSADIDVTLDNSFSAGSTVEIHNMSTTKVLTLKSNDGDTICKIIPLSYLVIMAKQATPTDATHWSTKGAGGGWASAGTVAGNFSAGFGTVTNITSKIKREGETAIISLVWQNGTVTTGAGTIVIPFGLTASTGSFTSRRRYGDIMLLNSSGQTIYTTTNSVGVGYYNGSNADKIAVAMNSNSNDYQASNVSDIMTSSEYYEAELRIPISGWEINN